MTKVDSRFRSMPWYVKVLVAVAVAVSACVATGCGTMYVDERDGEVGVCFPLYGEREDGEISKEDEST